MEMALDKLNALNPVLRSGLNTLSAGTETLGLILAIPQDSTQRAKKLVEVVKTMPSELDIIKKRMLGLNGWRALDHSEKALLEK